MIVQLLARLPPSAVDVIQLAVLGWVVRADEVEDSVGGRTLLRSARATIVG